MVASKGFNDSPQFEADTGLDQNRDAIVVTDVVSVILVPRDEARGAFNFTNNPILLELLHNQVPESWPIYNTVSTKRLAWRGTVGSRHQIAANS